MEKPAADIKLSSGRTIAHRIVRPGAQEAVPTTGDAEMTDAEWTEYCEIVKRAPRQI